MCAIGSLLHATELEPVKCPPHHRQSGHVANLHQVTAKPERCCVDKKHGRLADSKSESTGYNPLDSFSGGQKQTNKQTKNRKQTNGAITGNSIVKEKENKSTR